MLSYCPEPPIDPPDLEDPAGTYYYGVWIPDEQAQAERDALAAEVERLRAALLSRRFVDCTPDDGLPLRILLAYIDNSSWSDNTLGIEPTSPLCIELNRIQAERNAIINNAIRALQKAEGPC